MLVDSEQLANDIFAEMITLQGIVISGDESIHRFRGTEFSKILDSLERESGIELPDSFETDVRLRMSSTFKEHLQPMDGALRLVESMIVPFCVASSGPRNKIEENLDTTNLLPHFMGKIFSAYEHNSWKPDPGLFLAAAKYFNVAPSDCIVIEDSFVGVSAGLAANMTVIGLSPEEDDESVSAANRVFSSLDDIHRFFVSQGLSHE